MLFYSLAEYFFVTKVSVRHYRNIISESTNINTTPAIIGTEVRFTISSGSLFTDPATIMTTADTGDTARIFVTGLKTIGLIAALQEAMTGLQGSGLGFVLPLILVALTALIVLLSGSGTALFFAMVPLMVPLAAAAG